MVVMEVPFVLAQAAEPHSSTTLQSLLHNYYPNPTNFEELAIHHRVFRHQVASQFALCQRRAHVDARELFCGALCNPAFTKLRFKPEISRQIHEAPVSDAWLESKHTGSEPTKVLLQNGLQIDLLGAQPYSITLGGRSLFDGVQNEILLSASSSSSSSSSTTAATTQKALLYIDAKHGQIGGKDGLSYSDDIAPLIKKRLLMEQNLPGLVHILVITSNKKAHQQGGHPHTANTLLIQPGNSIIDPFTCVITSSCDSFAWALSPTFSSLLLLDDI